MAAASTSAKSAPASSQLPLWSDGDEAEWVVRESVRARRLAVRVLLTGQVEVVVPCRTSARTVERFVGRHRDWIAHQREKVRRLARPAEPFPPYRIELSACEQTLRVHLAGGRGRTRATVVAPGLLGISGPVDSRAAVQLALQRWLTTTARQTLEPMLARLARELDVRYGKIAIRRQRTRWGSCSTHGTISLNCCLLFQRPAVVRYLLIHELAHTVHMNHSRRFWNFVARHCGDYRRLDQELLEGWRRVPAWV